MLLDNIPERSSNTMNGIGLYGKTPDQISCRHFRITQPYHSNGAAASSRYEVLVTVYTNDAGQSNKLKEAPMKTNASSKHTA
jgi:hypothetical protein